MAKKKWRCHSCAYNNNNIACDLNNNNAYMSGQSYTCKDYEKKSDEEAEKSNVTPLLPAPNKPKVKFVSTDEVVYAFHD